MDADALWAAFWAYFGICAALIAAGMGFPIPEEIPVVTGGVICGNTAQNPGSYIRWWIMWPLCIIFVVISDSILYGAGRFWGTRLVRVSWIKHRWLPPERLERIESNFHQYGIKILLIARVLPAIRAPIFVVAGIMRLPFYKFVLADSIYAIPGVSLLFFLGFWFTDQFLEIVQKAESMRPLIIVVVITAVATYLVLHFLRRPVSTGAPEELELPRMITQVTHMIPRADETMTNPESTDPLPLPGSDGQIDQPQPGAQPPQRPRANP